MARTERLADILADAAAGQSCASPCLRCRCSQSALLLGVAPYLCGCLRRVVCLCMCVCDAVRATLGLHYYRRRRPMCVLAAVFTLGAGGDGGWQRTGCGGEESWCEPTRRRRPAAIDGVSPRLSEGLGGRSTWLSVAPAGNTLTVAVSARRCVFYDGSGDNGSSYTMSCPC